MFLFFAEFVRVPEAPGPGPHSILSVPVYPEKQRCRNSQPGLESIKTAIGGLD